MKVHLACGGTGGHIFPGLATAQELQTRGHEVTLWLAGKDVEASAVEGWSGRILRAPAEGLPSGFSPRTLVSVGRLLRASRICLRAMKTDRPDILVGMGSYATVGPAVAALRLRIPLVLHEANVIPGRAIQLFSRRARIVAAAFEETRYHLRRRNVTVTGMPLRAELLAHRADPNPAPPDSVLITGGSRGAHRLNEICANAVIRLRRRGHSIPVIHLTGVDDESVIRAAYAEAKVNARVKAFHLDMGALYRSASLAICRAGASTCAELTAFGLPALLIPYPFAARNHQWANAQALERTGAAHAVDEANLDPEWLAEYIAGSLQSPERLQRMRAASLARARTDGAEALATVVEQVAHARD